MSVSKQQCYQSRRLELDDGTIRVTENKLTRQALKFLPKCGHREPFSHNHEPSSP